MSVVAGIDVGNATTEVLVGRVARHRVDVIGSARAPTRRAKGSPESLSGAVTLVRRLERQYGVRVERVVAAPLRPVVTRHASLPEEAPVTGRLRIATAGSAIPITSRTRRSARSTSHPTTPCPSIPATSAPMAA